MSSGKHEKLAMTYMSKFTLIYKIAIQLLIFHLQGLQIFHFRKTKLASGAPYVSLLQTFKVGINIHFSNVASKYGLMF